MKRNMGKPIRKITVIIGGVLLAAAVAGTTFALLQKKSQTAQNDFAGAKVNVGVVENGSTYENGSAVNADYDKVKKGEASAKTVAVININSEAYPTTDTYVRVRLVPSFVYDQNTEYAGQTVAADVSQLFYTYGDTTDWKVQDQAGENYYYYTKALAPGETSSNLITAVTYQGEIPEDAHFQLQVLTEGIAANQTVQGSSSLKSLWGLDSFDSLQNVQ